MRRARSYEGGGALLAERVEDGREEGEVLSGEDHADSDDGDEVKDYQQHKEDLEDVLLGESGHLGARLKAFVVQVMGHRRTLHLVDALDTVAADAGCHGGGAEGSQQYQVVGAAVHLGG